MQFSISTQFGSIWPIDRTPSGATSWGQSGPGSNGNKGVLRIPPKLQHYQNLTIRLFSVISQTLVGGVLPLCRDAINVFCITNWLGFRCFADFALLYYNVLFRDNIRLFCFVFSNICLLIWVYEFCQSRLLSCYLGFFLLVLVLQCLCK